MDTGMIHYAYGMLRRKKSEEKIKGNRDYENRYGLVS